MLMNIDSHDAYFRQCLREHLDWRREMKARPSILNATTRVVQQRINQIIPEKVHQVVTKTIKELTRTVISGAGLTTVSGKGSEDFVQTEQHVRDRISFYTSSSTAEGAITGFGGFFAGLADFPLWLSLKMKMLFEIAQAYGMDVQDYRERLFILHVFQLTFSSQQKRRKIMELLENWEDRLEDLPPDWHAFDWKTFQLDYRDHIDLAKLLQLIPGFGAIAGAMVNHKYTKRLGYNAMQAYRMRLEEFRKPDDKD